MFSSTFYLSTVWRIGWPPHACLPQALYCEQGAAIEICVRVRLDRYTTIKASCDIGQKPGYEANSLLPGFWDTTGTPSTTQTAETPPAHHSDSTDHWDAAKAKSNTTGTTHHQGHHRKTQQEHAKTAPKTQPKHHWDRTPPNHRLGKHERCKQS